MSAVMIVISLMVVLGGDSHLSDLTLGGIPIGGVVESGASITFFPRVDDS